MSSFDNNQNIDSGSGASQGGASDLPLDDISNACRTFRDEGSFRRNQTNQSLAQQSVTTGPSWWQKEMEGWAIAMFWNQVQALGALPENHPVHKAVAERAQQVRDATCKDPYFKSQGVELSSNFTPIILHSSIPNAHVLPVLDGFVCITTEMIACSANLDKVTAMLAHENGHLIHKCLVPEQQQKEQSRKGEIIWQDPLVKALQEVSPVVAAATLFNKGEEMWSDVHGSFPILDSMGIDPYVVSAMLSEIARQIESNEAHMSKTASLFGLLSGIRETHPPSIERISIADLACQYYSYPSTLKKEVKSSDDLAIGLKNPSRSERIVQVIKEHTNIFECISCVSSGAGLIPLLDQENGLIIRKSLKDALDGLAREEQLAIFSVLGALIDVYDNEVDEQVKPASMRRRHVGWLEAEYRLLNSTFEVIDSNANIDSRELSQQEAEKQLQLYKKMGMKLEVDRKGNVDFLVELHHKLAKKGRSELQSIAKACNIKALEKLLLGYRATTDDLKDLMTPEGLLKLDKDLVSVTCDPSEFVQNGLLDPQQRKIECILIRPENEDILAFRLDGSQDYRGYDGYDGDEWEDARVTIDPFVYSHYVSLEFGIGEDVFYRLNDLNHEDSYARLSELLVQSVRNFAREGLFKDMSEFLGWLDEFKDIHQGKITSCGPLATERNLFAMALTFARSFRDGGQSTLKERIAAIADAGLHPGLSYIEAKENLSSIPIDFAKIKTGALIHRELSKHWPLIGDAILHNNTILSECDDPELMQDIREEVQPFLCALSDPHSFSSFADVIRSENLHDQWILESDDDSKPVQFIEELENVKDLAQLLRELENLPHRFSPRVWEHIARSRVQSLDDVISLHGFVNNALSSPKNYTFPGLEHDRMKATIAVVATGLEELLKTNQLDVNDVETCAKVNRLIRQLPRTSYRNQVLDIWLEALGNSENDVKQEMLELI